MNLSGANTYTGATNLVKGALVGASTTAFGSNGALTVAGGADLDLSDNITVGSLTGAGNIYALGGVRTLTVGGDNTSTTFSGPLKTAVALTKVGSGTLTLSGNNSLFSGGLTIDGGAVSLGSSNALGSSGTIAFGGGTLQYGASNTTDYSSRFSSAGSQLWSIDTNGQNVSFASALAGAAA